MTACILVFTLYGEIVGCLPPEKVVAMETMAKDEEAQWERLEAALEKVKK